MEDTKRVCPCHGGNKVTDLRWDSFFQSRMDVFATSVIIKRLDLYVRSAKFGREAPHDN